MASHSVNGLNLRLLLLILEVLMLLIASSYYDSDHSSFESDYTYVSSKYQQQRQMNASILALKTISASPSKKLKRKFLHSVMKYTTNGVSTFNPLILELEISRLGMLTQIPAQLPQTTRRTRRTRKANCALGSLCQEMVSN